MSGIIDSIRYSDIVTEVPEESHKHNMYQMIYIQEGKIRLHVSDADYVCQSPCLIFISNLEMHRIQVMSGIYRRYIVSLNPQQAAQVIKPPILLTVFSSHRFDFCHCLDLNGSEKQFDLLINQLMTECSLPEAGIPGDVIWFTALLSCIYRMAPGMFHESVSRISKTVENVKHDLEHNLEVNLNLSDIADKYYINRFYLSHSFKEITGYSIKQYRMLCRISLARELLEQTDISVNDIVTRCGFNDASNFTRYFREKTGMSPSEYREKTAQRNRTENESENQAHE